MVRDASHQKVIQQFSFIESLNLARGISQENQTPLNKSKSGQTTSKLSSANLAISAGEDESRGNAIVASNNDATATINRSWYDADIPAINLDWAEIVKYSNGGNYSANNNARNRNYLGKILFALACSYFLFVIWWLFGHQTLQISTRLTGGKLITLSKSDVDFIDYMERSLLQIEANQIASDQDKKVVYIPVYSPTPATPTVPQIPNNYIEPLDTSTEVLKIPAPPPLPAPTPTELVTPQASPPTVAASTQTPITPTPQHTLLGILDLGDNKSAALIKVKEQTVRVWLGEEINHSGWILESVADQTAKISYQGKTRMVSVGETF
ncbi:hypothetical protein NIES4102_13820 [Chondrocystis sp. NIES-4102]|nr:hypothetical protein NIES4102_13820 [Chondrocystis sp. NIES-4102]